MIEYLTGFIATLPSAYDDYLDYYVDDLTWIPYIPHILYLIYSRLNEILSIYVLLDLIIYFVILIPFYIIMQRIGYPFGEADMILYFILIFYEPLINISSLLPDYLIIMLIINIYGLLYGIYKKIKIGEDRIPMVALTPATILTAYILTYLHLIGSI